MLSLPSPSPHFISLKNMPLIKTKKEQKKYQEQCRSLPQKGHKQQQHLSQMQPAIFKKQKLDKSYIKHLQQLTDINLMLTPVMMQTGLTQAAVVAGGQRGQRLDSGTNRIWNNSFKQERTRHIDQQTAILQKSALQTKRKHSPKFFIFIGIQYQLIT